MNQYVEELQTASGFEYLNEKGETLLETTFEDNSEEFSEIIELNDFTIWRPTTNAISYGHVTLLPPYGTPKRLSRGVVIDRIRIGDIDCNYMMKSLAELLENTFKCRPLVHTVHC